MAQSKGIFKPREWYRLDNAAKIFPGQNTQKWSNIFASLSCCGRKWTPQCWSRLLL